MPGGRLRGKLKVNLRHLRLVEFAQVAGDFDGDGHLDFLRLGGGRQVAIHRGQGGGRFPARPDLTFDLLRAPQDTALAEVRDVDGDGRSDLMVITVLDADESGATRPTRVEFYLTGDGS